MRNRCPQAAKTAAQPAPQVEYSEMQPRRRFDEDAISIGHTG
jgi:hypothetical protein